ncbi:Dehydrogenase/reductase SDR family member 1 [Schistosoma japonicum]|nr:Dehydrogenase/reductase SDR family member 1 [Schistosoma japonicum]KAH8855833.1 Dehydrogenase/reductase SDR family member 1 [Schistosoma japonicum]KAH8855836.1 Dehydrogenase/reductase SDR family member 1 [Schistosoma japonicum]KAH8855837.1 Dehydrogenase/reductase SDR family member 1 [Schistosoma japonicum]
MPSDLSGYVCVVTGASRGVGQGIAIGLGKAGATVYLTGRTLSAENGKGVCLRDTAHIINASGGKAIPVAVDHSDDTQVAGLFSRIHKEQSGRLDIFVNCAFSATDYLLVNDNSPYWESKLRPNEEWDLINRVGLRNAYICNVLATRMMIKCREQPLNNCVQDSENTCNHSLTSTATTLITKSLPTGLIVNISSLGGITRIFNVAFCAGKSSLDRISQEMAHDLKEHNANISVVSIIPGLIQTESVVSAYESGNSFKLFGYEASLRMAMPAPILGDIIAHLAQQSNNKKLIQCSGRCLFAPDLASEFGIKSYDGSNFINLRSIKVLLQLIGWKHLAILFPGFIKVPYWLVAIFMSKF